MCLKNRYLNNQQQGKNYTNQQKPAPENELSEVYFI